MTTLVLLVGGYIAFLLLLGGCAGYITLFETDSDRREHAYKVLKLALGTGSGGAGLLGAIQLLQHLPLN
jgi:hypothetical protein